MASNFIPEEARLCLEVCHFPSRRGVRETRCFLTRCTSVDSVNSESCSEVVFFCATTVVYKRHRFVFQHSFPSLCSCVVDSALGHDRCVLGLKENSSKCHPHSCTYIVTSVLWFCVFLPIPLFLVMISGCLCKSVWWLIYSCADLCWLLWTRLYGSVVRAVDCRSAGPWFNSGWKSWFTFMTCSDNPMNQISQMFISKSPITRNSVKRKSKEKQEPKFKRVKE